MIVYVLLIKVLFVAGYAGGVSTQIIDNIATREDCMAVKAQLDRTDRNVSTSCLRVVKVR